jgi:hypothetical protein
MRARTVSLALAATLLTASAASAAPTCENKYGDAARCGAGGAMPVGQVLSPAERQYWRPDTPIPPGEVLGLTAILGGLAALILLMPKFDGSNGADWGRQEDDDRD